MTSLASTLKAAIDAWGETQTNNLLMRLARAGSLTPRAVALYLTSLQALFVQSQLNLRLAHERTAAEGQVRFARYFQGKVREERGHEQWAADDLQKLPTHVAQGLAPAPAIAHLAQLQRELLDQHPMCFIVYIVWAEYLTVLLGDAWLDALALCGHERGALTAVAKHIDADRAHAAHGLETLDELWGGEPGVEQLLACLTRAEQAFAAFCQQICEEALLGTTTCMSDASAQRPASDCN